MTALPRSADRAAMAAALHRMLQDGAAPRMVRQAIVDLRRGRVVGYELLARFPGPVRAGPDEWFACATEEGVAAELELRVVDAALETRAFLPRNTFLTVNVTPGALCSDVMSEWLDAGPDLSAIVFEVTEQQEVPDPARLLAALGRVRACGASIAVDDAGAGYASMHQILTIRPQFVKLDRRLVDGIAGDPAKRALVELIGQFADRVDAWLIAEGVEGSEDLRELARLRVPLAQGYHLGRPEPLWSELTEEREREVVALWVCSEEPPTLAHLALTATVTPHGTPIADIRDRWERDGRTLCAVGLDPHGRARSLRSRPDMEQQRNEPRAAMTVAIGEDPTAVLRRALARPEGRRFDPVVVRRADGGVLGAVAIDTLFECVAGAAPPPEEVTGEFVKLAGGGRRRRAAT